MQIVLEPGKYPGSDSPTIVTVGVFDGVHLGHLAILSQVLHWAEQERAQSAVVTFRRHPDSLLKGKSPPAITSLEHRLVLLDRLGFDLCLVLPFDDTVRSLSAEEFCKAWLVKKLKAKGIVLGPDNAIGRHREGTPERLAELGDSLGFRVQQVGAVKVPNGWASSTRIRDAIQEGDLETAEKMLGRRPSLYGRIVHGDARGNAIGFPTANFNLHHEVLPPRGVYFCWTLIEGKQVYGLVNIGRRPTFKEKEPEDIVEAFFLDYEGELYGKNLELILGPRIRDEKKFDGAEALKKQIELDIARVRQMIPQA